VVDRQHTAPRYDDSCASNVYPQRRLNHAPFTVQLLAHMHHLIQFILLIWCCFVDIQATANSTGVSAERLR
jgi:hypothetical protein